MQKMNILKKISIRINTDQNRSSKGGGYVKVYHLEKNNIDSIPPQRALYVGIMSKFSY